MTLFICTTEDSGVDRYSRELASRLPVSVVQTKRYELGLHVYSFIKKVKSFKDIVHFPNQHFGRYAILAGLPYVITVHDVERMCFPFASEGILERMGLKLDAFGIRRARHIITVSESSKADLVKYLAVPEGSITVIHNGVDHGVFKPSASRPLPFPYILYVGSERSRKNLSRLLAAFALLKKSDGFHDLKLVKTGSAGRSRAFRASTLQAVQDLGLDGQVIFTGRLDDHELAAYYSSAAALAYPSLYEGFGLPVLEAMACSCPVITSNISSLPEVAGNAAILVNPYSIEELYEAMTRVLTDDNLRGQLVRRGLEHSHGFSWTRAAAATLAVYREIASAEAVRLAPQYELGEKSLSGNGRRDGLTPHGEGVPAAVVCRGTRSARDKTGVLPRQKPEGAGGRCLRSARTTPCAGG